MPFTHDQQNEFQRLFALRRRRQMILAVPLLAVFIAVMAVKDRPEGVILGLPANMVGPVFLALAVGALLFSLWNWRCPACAKYLGKSISPRFCPKCGVALQSER